LFRAGAPVTLAGAMKGQASIDYVAILLLVAVAGASAASAARGAAVAPEVRRQMARALCVVRGGDCEVDRRPCVVASRSSADVMRVSVAVLRLGHDRLLVREQRSDGTVAVTLSEGDEGGVGLSTPGVHVRVSLGGRALGLGGEATAAALAARRAGRTWVLRDGAEADALVGVLRRPGRLARDPSVLARFGPPAADFNERGLAVDAGASGAKGDLSLGAADMFGTREDHVTGRRTSYVRRSGTASIALAVRGGGAGASATPSEQYAVTVDRDGRPLDLAVVSIATYAAYVRLPRDLQVAAGLLGTPGRRARTLVREEHLDLTDAGNLELARAFLAQVDHPHLRLGDAVDVSAQLARRLDAVGVIDVRSYDADSRHYGVDVGGSVGLQLGASYDHDAGESHLRAAATRGIDGRWRTRGDCLAQA
jgi:hypothetical protein